MRVIAATNMPLEEKVANGSFRQDLYYRLNVIRLHVPPLRERRSEIPPMINYYVNHYSSRFGKTGINITPQTVDLLMVCDWDGNVRQLCNEIQRIVARAVDGETITPDSLSPELKRIAKPLVPFAGSEKRQTNRVLHQRVFVLQRRRRHGRNARRSGRRTRNANDQRLAFTSQLEYLTRRQRIRLNQTRTLSQTGALQHRKSRLKNNGSTDIRNGKSKECQHIET